MEHSTGSLVTHDETNCILSMCPTFLQSGVIQRKAARSNLNIMCCTSWSSEHVTGCTAGHFSFMHNVLTCCGIQSAQGPKCLSSHLVQPATAHVKGVKPSPYSHLSDISRPVEVNAQSLESLCERSTELHPCVSITVGLKGSEGHGY